MKEEIDVSVMKRAMKEEIAVSVLKQVKETLDKYDIEFWLNIGTLLGAVRDGKFIPWDHDIDTAMWYEDLPKLASAAEELRRKGFAVYGQISYPRNYHIYDIHTNVLGKEGCPLSITLYRLKDGNATFRGSRPTNLVSKFFKYLSGVLSAPRYFELTHYQEVNRETTPSVRILLRKSLIQVCSSLPSSLRKSLAEIVWVIHKKFGCKQSQVAIPSHYFEKLSTIKFYGMEFKVPAEKEEYLAYMYGEDWRVPKRGKMHRFFYKTGGIIK